MPITPRFVLSQSPSLITIHVNVPHVRVGDTEIDIDGFDVSIYCKPYLLKLQLPGRLIDDDRAVASYNPDEHGGTLIINVPKETPGENFPDLDLTTRLLAPPPTFPLSRISYGGEAEVASAEDELSNAFKKSLNFGEENLPSRRQPPSIEVLASEDFEEAEKGDSATSAERQQSSQVQSSSFTPPHSKLLVENPASTLEIVHNADWEAGPSALGLGWGYGFNRKCKGMFAGALQGELALGLLELKDPEGTAPPLRSVLRKESEIAKWDAARYVDDWLGGEEEALHWLREGSHIWWRLSGACAWEWKDEERIALAKLPRREFLLDGEVLSVGSALAVGGAAAAFNAQSDVASLTQSLESRPETTRLLAGLVTLLFAYAYDCRQTDGEGTVESSWTIVTLSPLLSWLDDEFQPHPAEVTTRREALPQSTIRAALFSCIVRSLTFPYLRRWDLAIECARDVVGILERGRRPALRAVLSILKTLGSGGDTSEGSGGEDHRYLLNTLYISDYAVWLQLVSEHDLKAAAKLSSSALLLLESKDGKTLPEFSHMALNRIETDFHGDHEKEEEEEEE